MDDSTRRKICRLVAGLVVADDDLDATEDAVVDNMLRLFGLDPDDREWLFPIVDPAEAAQELSSMARDVQSEAFEMLVRAAAADKRYAREERDYLVSAGKVLGLAPEDIEKRVHAAIAAQA